MLSFTEENYLKALIQLTTFDGGRKEIGVNKLANELGVKPATVSDMVRKLKEKSLVNYERYGKVSLTKEGAFRGMMVIRRHRLWETFLQEKLGFSWDEVHEVAEELEHIHSQKLINKLDEFLEFPDFDPHGDAIPDAEGNIVIPSRRLLADIEEGKLCRIIAVKESNSDFLQYVDRMNLKINDEVKVISKDSFDDLITIEYQGETKVVSPKFSHNVYVVCAKCNKANCNC